MTYTKWLWQVMQEAGEEIMGMSASDLKALEDDAKAYDAALQHANLRPLTFNLRVAEDTYNDETRIKKSVNRQDQLTVASVSWKCRLVLWVLHADSAIALLGIMGAICS